MNDIHRSKDEAINDKVARNQTDVLHAFKISFFAMCRLPTFPWDFLQSVLETDKSSELMSQILKQTCLHPLCSKHPPSVKYRRLFLTELIRRHESTDAEPLDELYDALGGVLGCEESSKAFKSYLLPSGGSVTLSESVAVISEGTTGLVTWEAALHLAEWALDNPHVFSGRTVLELGSGVGLTGMVVCLSCSPARYIFSDFHSRVLQKLRDNVQLNGMTNQHAPRVSVEELANQHTPRVSVEELDWATVTEEQLEEIGAKVIIAADVVYDPEVIECLVQLLSKALRCSSSGLPPEVYISSTVRNPDTYNCFKHQLENAGISHDVIAGPVSHVFPYNRLSTIELIKLYI